MVLKEQIDKIVQEGDWAFASLLKLNDVCEELSNNYYSGLDPAIILELIWDVKLNDGGKTLGHLISFECKNIIKKEFMTSFQKCFETATVQFKSPAKETLRVESITEEQPPLPKPKAEKPDTKKEMIKGEDGLDMPKGVKRV